MKLQLIAVTLLATAAAGAALAQGTFSPNKPKAPWTASSPQQPSPAYTPPKPKSYGAPEAKTYGAPEPKKAEPFKPYEPYKPKSVFGPDGKPKR